MYSAVFLFKREQEEDCGRDTLTQKCEHSMNILEIFTKIRVAILGVEWYPYDRV